MSRTIHQGKKNNGAIFPQKRIGNDGTNDGEEIGSRGKKVKIGGGVFFRIGVENAVTGHEILGHEDDENRPYAIKTKTFRNIVNDNVGDAPGHI